MCIPQREIVFFVGPKNKWKYGKALQSIDFWVGSGRSTSKLRKLWVSKNRSAFILYIYLGTYIAIQKIKVSKPTL